MKRVNIEGKKPHDKPSNKSNHFIYIPFAANFKLNFASLSIIHSLLKGTESKEWLTLAEDQVYKIIKAKSK